MKSKLERLVTYLIDERNAQRNGPRFEKPTQHATQDELWKLFRALVNTREPIHASQEFYELQEMSCTSSSPPTASRRAPTQAPPRSYRTPSCGVATSRV